MPSPEHYINLLFWIVVGVVLIVGLFVWGFVKVVSLLAAKRELAHHPQVSGHQGINIQTTNTTTTTNNTVTIDEINLGAPRLPGG